MIKIKQLIKSTISFLLYYSGFMHFLRKVKLKDKAFVLMYHRVLPDSMLEKTYSSDGIVLRDKSFDKQLSFIKNNFKVVDIEEFLLFLNGETNYSKPVCLITFDDGWFDNYEYAFSILKKYNLPATIFLSYKFINKNEPFWQEKINRYIRTKMAENNPKKLEIFHSEILNEFLLDKKEFSYVAHPNYFVKELLGYLKLQEFEKILTIVKICEKGLNNGFNYYPDVFLNWDQISEMKKHRIRFESHGLSHKILPNLSDEQKYLEISESKNA